MACFERGKLRIRRTPASGRVQATDRRLCDVDEPFGTVGFNYDESADEPAAHESVITIYERRYHWIEGGHRTGALIGVYCDDCFGYL
jgi:hypothetical protein